jgi:stage II sporulation protein D
MKKLSFAILTLMLVLLIYLPVYAQDLVRIGLERSFRNQSTINIANTHILVGSESFRSSGGFSVRMEGVNRVALYDGNQLILLANASEALTIRDAEGGPVSMGQSRYRGAVDFGNFGGAGVSAVNILSKEEYLYGVVASEMARHFHPEALKAQAVAARSYMNMRIGAHSASGYDLCDQGHCQAYRGMGQEHTAGTQAVNDTRGVVMYHNNEPINAVYFSSSGGATDDSENVWTQTIPYLRGKAELVPEYDPRVWSRTFTWHELTSLLAANNTSIGTANNVAITRVSPAGRVQELTITGTSGVKVLTKEEIRTFFSLSTGGSLDSRFFSIGGGGPVVAVASVTVTDGRTTQTGTINDFYGLSAGNASFTIRNATVFDGKNSYEYQERQAAPPATASGGSGVTFSGSGWGHGVGMSQRGAEAMARHGYTYLDILNHYYTGIVIR